MKIIHWIVAFLYLGGIAVAGSDGAWFPWVNFFGLLMLISACLIARKTFD